MLFAPFAILTSAVVGVTVCAHPATDPDPSADTNPNLAIRTPIISTVPSNYLGTPPNLSIYPTGGFRDGIVLQLDEVPRTWQWWEAKHILFNSNGTQDFCISSGAKPKAGDGVRIEACDTAAADPPARFQWDYDPYTQLLWVHDATLNLCAEVYNEHFSAGTGIVLGTCIQSWRQLWAFHE